MQQGNLGRRSFLLGAAIVPTGMLTSGFTDATTEPNPSGFLTRPNIRNASDNGMVRPTTSSLLLDARRSRRYFGAAARIDQIVAEPTLRDIIITNCGSLTPEIHLKWDSLEWRQGEFNYSPVDKLIEFGRRHKMAVRGHTLIWDQSTPEWAKTDLLARGDWSLIAGHFSRTLGRYAADIREWDVVNEPIDTETGVDGLRRTTLHKAFGPNYIRRALEEARSHAPTARLLINDYGFDYRNPVDAARRVAFVRLLTRLKREGTPIDGVGLQAHLDVSKGPLAAEELRAFPAQHPGPRARYNHHRARRQGTGLRRTLVQT